MWSSMEGRYRCVHVAWHGGKMEMVHVIWYGEKTEMCTWGLAWRKNGDVNMWSSRELEQIKTEEPSWCGSPCAWEAQAGK